MFPAGGFRAGLKTKIVGGRVLAFDTIGSTNDHLLALAREGAPEGIVVIAETQTEGRGRFGRGWSSPPGCNLYFSVLLRPSLSPASLPQITLVAAVSLCETLRETTDLDVRVKWPNDLVIGEKKICGILTEMTTRGKAAGAAVLGVGLNVNMEDALIPEGLRGIATSLCCEAGRRFDRSALLRRLLVSLDGDYRLFLREGFEPFRDRFAEHSSILGKEVRVEAAGRRMEGKAAGIDREGMLLVATEGGESIRVASGEISLLPVRLAGKADRGSLPSAGDG